MFLTHLSYPDNASLRSFIDTFETFDEAVLGFCHTMDSLIQEDRVPTGVRGIIIDIPRKVGVARLLSGLDTISLEDVSDDGALPADYFKHSDLDAPVVERGQREPHRYGQWNLRYPTMPG